MSYQIPLKYILPAFVALLVLLIAAWAFGLSPVAALTGSNPQVSESNRQEQVSGYPYDTIVVSGFGTATGVPDLANLSLGVSVTADTVASAREQAATSMQEVMQALANNDVESADIRTSHFGVHAQYDWNPSSGVREFQGYTVSNRLNVTVRDIETAGTIIDEVITAGGDDIEFNSLSFAFSDTAALEKQARAVAVANMEEKARQLAEFSERSPGNLKIISESSVPDVFGVTREFAAAFAADSGASTPISVGEDEVSVTVQGVYELR